MTNKAVIASTLALLACLAALAAGAAVPRVSDRELLPTREQVLATRLISAFMTEHHYRRVPLDDELSRKVFDRYLESLDPNRSYFLAGEVERLGSRYREQMDDALARAELDPIYEVFRLFRVRLDERATFAEEMLRRDFDFAREENHELDRSDAQWARSHSDLDDIWRRRVKHDVLTLRLGGRSDEEIEDTLRKRYRGISQRVGQFRPNDVFQVFMNAYTESVEPHTGYFSPRTSEDFRIRMSLSLEGIGAALQTENEYTVIRRLIPGGPAVKSGQLQVEDRITGVGEGDDGDMIDVISWRLEDVVQLIRGPKESIVRLEVLPKGAADGGTRRVVKLVRNRIKLEEQAASRSVLQTPAGPVGVIELPTFYLDVAARSRGEEDYRSTTRDVRRLLGELRDEGVAGVVMDLRGNGGGSLTEAIELTGLFIRSGPIVQVRESDGRTRVYRDPDPGVAYEGPLVVMVDRHSASASEIFAGAIQDYGRGLVVGEPTFGKGTVQSLLDLAQYVDDPPGDLGQLKVTIAQFFRVTGGSTQHRGVTPDIVFPTAFDFSDHGERSLENALPWARVQPARFDPVMAMSGGTVADVKDRHEKRLEDNPVFDLVVDRLRLQVEAAKRQTTTLVESRRRKERDSRENMMDALEARVRELRGLPPVSAEGGEASARAPEEEGPDLWLEEGSRILADYISLSRPAEPVIKTAGEFATTCPARDC